MLLSCLAPRVPFLGLCFGFAMIHVAASAGPAAGTVVDATIDSVVLRDNRVGLKTERAVKIYLPPGYAESDKSYPVAFYFHSLNWGADRLFRVNKLGELLDRAIAAGNCPELIVVAADYTAPVLGSLFENSPVSGRWRDFTTEELLPYIENHFRTIRHRDSRALIGDFMGGRGALELAMTRADLFSVVYAMHPVATGTGELPINYLNVDWRKIAEAKSVSELTGGDRSQIYVLICQAFLPNVDKPPFFCDFPMEWVEGAARMNPDNNRKLQRGFLLEETLDEGAKNLRSLRGLAFDWGRYDPTPAHVFANQVFSRKLDDLGVEHDAEEYRGNPWEKNFTANGRFGTRVLPFLARHLVFVTRH